MRSLLDYPAAFRAFFQSVDEARLSGGATAELTLLMLLMLTFG